MPQSKLPFEVGQIVEAKSFELGYRGAWFRCKILKIYKKNKELVYDLEYLDFPDECIHVTQVFEKQKGGSEKQLMVRPIYPPLYHENEVQNMKGDHEPLLVVHGLWKVGDLVDWWFDDCFWCAKIIQVKESNKFQVELLPPPYGEGEKYEALNKDLRPSLEWSLKDGWTVPCRKDRNKRQCVKLVPLKKRDQAIEEVVVKTEEQQTGRVAKKLKTDGEMLNIMESDAIEAAIFDLEELIGRIKWLESMIGSDVGNAKSFSELNG